MVITVVVGKDPSQVVSANLVFTRVLHELLLQSEREHLPNDHENNNITGNILLVNARVSQPLSTSTLSLSPILISHHCEFLVNKSKNPLHSTTI